MKLSTMKLYFALFLLVAIAAIAEVESYRTGGMSEQMKRIHCQAWCITDSSCILKCLSKGVMRDRFG